jgi:hypothetical protein
MSSVMFLESCEEIEPEEPVRAVVESSWPYRFASTSASATSSTPPPIVLEATPIEGTVSVLESHCDHVPTGLVTQPP